MASLTSGEIAYYIMDRGRRVPRLMVIRPSEARRVMQEAQEAVWSNKPRTAIAVGHVAFAAIDILEHEHHNEALVAIS